MNYNLFKQVHSASQLSLYVCIKSHLQKLREQLNAGTANSCWHWFLQRKMQEAPLFQIDKQSIFQKEENSSFSDFYTNEAKQAIVYCEFNCQTGEVTYQKNL